MSYDIFYRHQFIKLPDDTYLPHAEIGCSNVFEMTGSKRERRARSWWVLRHHNDKLNLTREELLGEVDDYIQTRIEQAADARFSDPEPDAKKVKAQFGYWASIAINGASTRNTTAGMYRGFFVNGMKHAKTVEELGGVYIKLNKYQQEDAERNGKEILHATLCFKGDYALEVIARFTAMYGNQFDVDVACSNWQLDRIIGDRPRRERSSREKKMIPHYFILKMNNGGFLVRKTKWGYRYTTIAETLNNKKFKTEKAAVAYAEKVFGLPADAVVRVNQPAYV